jgi:circadian clock protein KaiB
MKAKSMRRQHRQSKLWQLRLYVIGQTAKSQTALSNLKTFCEHNLKGCYHITVIDLMKRPELAKQAQIVAIPTVVRTVPKPVRTVIGNFSDAERALDGLDLRASI